MNTNFFLKSKAKDIPIFFALDDKYIPFLAVALESMIDHISSKNNYIIKILYTDLSENNMKRIIKYRRKNVSIEFVDLSYYIKEFQDKLYTRDYYTKTTYFRLFLPELYPQYDKVIYLDCDICILDDIADLYNINIRNNLLAAAPDESVLNVKQFQEYVEKVIGVASYKSYFNAGILLMNLEELRKFNFHEKFMYLLSTNKYTVAQDQDYLNRLCKGRVKLIDGSWNKMPFPVKESTLNSLIMKEDLKIIHYNLWYKPWHFEEILYKENFWNYAKKTEFFDEIKKIKKEYKDETKFRDMEVEKNLKELAQKESDCVGDDRYDVQEKTKRYIKKVLLTKPVREKAKDRLEILDEIERLEREGKFDVDPEKDPPTIVLTPENVDYLNEKQSSKIKTLVANKIGAKFLDEILKNNKLIIKEVNGLDNLESCNNGAIITCNHFNPFDVFTVEKVFRMTSYAKNKTLYKIIREGNYTNFPGLYGFLFRNSDTLPLSSDVQTMIQFLKSVKTILQRGDYILIYPEQSLWWNYKKPKPLKDGAFKFASQNNKPVIPIFITMTDSEIIGDDGFPVQEYIVNIGKPIYPEEGKTVKENTKMLKDKNFETWKNTYEMFYKIPLEYTTEKGIVESNESKI